MNFCREDIVCKAVLNKNGVHQAVYVEVTDWDKHMKQSEVIDIDYFINEYNKVIEFSKESNYEYVPHLKHMTVAGKTVRVDKTVKVIEMPKVKVSTKVLDYGNTALKNVYCELDSKLNIYNGNLSSEYCCKNVMDADCSIDDCKKKLARIVNDSLRYVVEGEYMNTYYMKEYVQKGKNIEYVFVSYSRYTRNADYLRKKSLWKEVSALDDKLLKYKSEHTLATQASEFRTCPSCGSKINLSEYLNNRGLDKLSTKCPICEKGELQTKGKLAVITKLETERNRLYEEQARIQVDQKQANRKSGILVAITKVTLDI